MFDNEHFTRSRSFSGWIHTLLVSRATASPWEVRTPERSGLPKVGPSAPDYGGIGAEFRVRRA